MLFFYRFEYNGGGIYGAVEQFCPRDDPRRQQKPDGSWLPKKGHLYPNAQSFWTKIGLELYQKSGLLDWHLSVLPGEVTVCCSTLIGEPFYQDDFQIIVDAQVMQQVEEQPARSFIAKYSA